MWEDDLFDRKKTAEFIQNHLDKRVDVKVFNLDSPWGTGKTFFLEKWASSLRDDRAVVYFNAWSKDYSEDPFVSLVSEIQTQLSEHDEENLGSNINDMVRKAASVFLATLPVLTKGAFTSATSRYAGIDSEQLADIASDTVGETAERAVEKYIESNSATENIINSFLESFNDLAEHLSKKFEGKPLYILVDELDRCRPIFAIELLERIKHLFNVPNVKFVVATDTKQLEHSINAIYGFSFDSASYLERFFDISYSLDNSDLLSWIKAKIKFSNELKDVNLGIRQSRRRRRDNYSSFDGGIIDPSPECFFLDDDEVNRFQFIFYVFCKVFNVSLRRSLQIFMQIDSAINNVKSREVHFFLIAYLVFVKNHSRGLFEDLSKNKIKSFLQGVSTTTNSCTLYFGSSNENVHDIARFYLDVSSMSKANLSSYINNRDGKGWKSRAASSFFDQSEPDDYIALVNFAYGFS